MKKANSFLAVILMTLSISTIFSQESTQKGNSIIDSSKTIGLKLDPNTSGCGYAISDALRNELIKNGFLIIDANGQGFNFFGKMENVFPQKIYFYYNNQKYRAMFIAQPAVYKEYVGMQYVCGKVIGYPIKTTGSPLEMISLNIVNFTE